MEVDINREGFVRPTRASLRPAPFSGQRITVKERIIVSAMSSFLSRYLDGLSFEMGGGVL